MSDTTLISSLQLSGADSGPATAGRELGSGPALGGGSGASGFQAALAAIEAPSSASVLSRADQAAVDRRSGSVAWTEAIGADRAAPLGGAGRTGATAPGARRAASGAQPRDDDESASALDAQEPDEAGIGAASGEASAAGGDDESGADARAFSQSAGLSGSAAQSEAAEASSGDASGAGLAASDTAITEELSPTLARLVSSRAAGSAIGVRISIGGDAFVTARARLRDGVLHLTLGSAHAETAKRLAGSLDELRSALSRQLGGAQVEVQLSQSGTGEHPSAGSGPRGSADVSADVSAEVSPEGGVSAANSADAVARQSQSEPALHSALIAHGTGIDLLV